MGSRIRWQKAGTTSVLALTTTLFTAGCWSSFEKVDEGATNAGGAGSGGSASGGTNAGGADPGVLAPADDVYTTPQGETLSIGAPGVLDNDGGIDLSVVSSNAATDEIPTSIQPVRFSINENGSVEFEPAADFWGEVQATYRVRDAAGDEAEATVTIRVSPKAIDLGVVSLAHQGFAIEGVTGDSLGRSLAPAGDVNDDGIDDLLIGAAPDSASAGVAGRAVIVLGRTNWENLDLASLPSERVVVLEGGAGDCAGLSVDGAGDLNDDGIDDVLVGAPGCSGGRGDGAAYVVFGSKTIAQTIDLSSLSTSSTGGNGFAITGGVSAQDALGLLVRGRADVDGDGATDVVVSTWQERTSNGAGVAAALSPQTAGTLAADLFTPLGSANNPNFPLAIDVLPDLDDDGRDELILASQSRFAVMQAALNPDLTWPVSYNGFGPLFGWQSSTAAVTMDSPSVAHVGDFDGNGRPDLVLCTGNQSCDLVLGTNQLDLDDPDWTIVGLDDSSAAPSVAGGLDLGRGPESEFVLTDGTGAFVIWGRESIPTQDLDVTELGERGLRIRAEGGAPLEAVTTLGDVNGDGQRDFAVGAPSADSGKGRVYVVSGLLLD